jgi:hypothetical protein
MDEWGVFQSDIFKEEVDREILKMLRTNLEMWYASSPIDFYHQSHKFICLWVYQPTVNKL